MVIATKTGPKMQKEQEREKSCLQSATKQVGVTSVAAASPKVQLELSAIHWR